MSWLELMCDFCRPIFGDSPGRWVFPRTDANGDPLHTGKGLEGPSVRQQVVRQKLECDPARCTFSSHVPMVPVFTLLSFTFVLTST